MLRSSTDDLSTFIAPCAPCAPCTPPRPKCAMHTVNDPYILPGTPEACKFQASLAAYVSPKPRTPSRTRFALQSMNTPSPGISPALSLCITPRTQLSLAAMATPTSAMVRCTIRDEPSPAVHLFDITCNSVPEPDAGAIFAPLGCNSQDSSAMKIFALVEFKRHRTLQYESPYVLQPGEYVVVEGDEGEDLGKVTKCWLAPAGCPPVADNSTNSNRACHGQAVDPATGHPIYPRVLRPAAPKEVHHLQGAQQQAEIKCAEAANLKVQQHRLPMTVVDAEYQFDRKKLTFYYVARDRVDFRALVRDLYKLYRARIWMSKAQSA